MTNNPNAGLDFDSLIHPSRRFSHPMDVVRDAALSHSEKKALLASWASDACAIEAVPELRALPGEAPVKWDDIMDAMHVLDGLPSEPAPSEQPLWRSWSTRRRGNGSACL